MTAAGSWSHCGVKTISRSAGRSVVAAAAYRLGVQLHEAEVDQTHDYRRRSGVAAKLTCAPADAPAWAHDPEQLWNAANAAEKRKNSTLAREIELALPAAVSPAARMAIVQAMAQELVDRYGVAVSAAIHAPGRQGDQRNHHAHILFTTRRMEPEGLGAKTRVLDDRKTGPEAVTYLRGFACDLINAALEDAGSDERVDHRSFAARGIGQEPTTHLGPAAAAKERRAERSERGDDKRQAEERNQQLDELVEELADLNARIAAAEEEELDARYGPADPEPGAGRETPSSSILQHDLQEVDDFAIVHRETIAQLQMIADSLAALAPAEPQLDGGDFAAVHEQTILQAGADAVLVQVEAAGEGGGLFQRFFAWLRNMWEHVVGREVELPARIEIERDRWPQHERDHDMEFDR